VHGDLATLPPGCHDRVGRRLGDVGQHAAPDHGQGGGLARLGGQASQDQAGRADERAAAGLAREVDEAEPQRVGAALLVVGDQPLLFQGRQDAPGGGPVQACRLGQRGGRAGGTGGGRHGPEQGGGALDGLHPGATGAQPSR